MASKRILIAEEALRDQKAHWYSYIKTIEQEATRVGWNVDVACNYQATADVVTGFSAFPVFLSSYYLDQSTQGTLIRRKLGFVTHSFSCLKVLWTFLKKRPVYEEVFVPTAVMHHLLCWWFIMLFHAQKPKRLTLFFVTNPGRISENKERVVFSKSTILMSILLSLFKPMIRRKSVRLAVETRGAQNEFQTISKLQFDLFPHPVPLMCNIEDVGKNRLSAIKVFSSPGFARHEKGSDLLKDAIENLLKSNYTDLKFIIQWTDPFTLPDGALCTPGELLSNHQQVKLITGPLNNNEYQELIKKTDCMILPYRNRSYYARVSRVAIEAACAGIPIIYSKGGWLEELVSNFGSGVGFQDGSLDDLLQAIHTMKRTIDDLKTEARTKAQHARNYFSPSNFTSHLFRE